MRCANGIWFASRVEALPLITIAICTYNRAECLEGSVSSSFEQKTDFPFEVLVVDNNSADRTPEALSELKERYPRLRTVTEPKQGLSHARNRALQESEADYVAFIDDDCILLPGWLQEIAAGFDSPDIGAVGGRTRVKYPYGKRPDWMIPSIEGLLGKCDHGEKPVDVEAVGGGNMAVRRLLALELGGFSPGLGYSGRRVIPGEDNEICRRIIESGYRVVYLPKAELLHCVDETRLSMKWIRRRMRLNGSFIAAVWPERVSVLRAALSCAKCWIASWFLRRKNPRQALQCEMEVQSTLGALDVLLPGIPGVVLRSVLLLAVLPVAICRLVCGGRLPEVNDR